MIKRRMVVVLLSILASSPLSAQNTFLKTSDALSFDDKNQQSIDLLMSNLSKTSDPATQAQIYWRLSRDTLHLTDDIKSQGGTSTDKLLDMYNQGEAYADRAIALDANSARGYYWKASNIGRWGQARGILASLFKADPMRKLLVTSASLDPTMGDTWFVLGQLYEQVPGFPLSFGNPVWAVSLGRKAVDARTLELQRGVVPDIPQDYFIQLANHLAKRDWSAARRKQEQPGEAQKFATTIDVVEKNFYYEGSVAIPDESDRQEAIALVQKVVDTLQAVANRTQSQQRDLTNATNDLTAWSP